MSKSRNSFKKFKDPDLYVIATDKASVREVEPDGTIPQGSPVRFIGKRHLEHTYQESNTRFVDKNGNGAGVICVMDWEVIPEGVVVPFSARTINELKLGHLLPGNAETAALANVQFTGDR